MNIKYRKLLPHESKLYRAIRLESLKQFPDSFEANYLEALKTKKLRMEVDIENQTAEKFVFGAFTNQQLIGICAFVKHENHSGNIYQMYIKKDFQGQNIGSGLIQSIIHEAYKKFNVTEVYLEVASKCSPAYHLYKKNGFKEINNEDSKSGYSEVIVMRYIL